MPSQPLARVVDPEALESPGRKGRLRIEVPQSWMLEGAALVVTVPKRVPCATCEGGGCDACERSGAFRTPKQQAARQIHLRLPGGSNIPFALRLVRPFDDHPLEQLIVEVHEGDEVTERVRRLEVLAPPQPSRLPAFVVALLVVALLGVALALVAWLLLR